MNKNFFSLRCGICGGGFESMLEARDKMYGKSEIFTYGQCEDCECLQCLEIPNDLSMHYPSDYYSFRNQSRSRFKKFKRKIKLKLIFNHPNFLSPIIRVFTKNYERFWTYRRLGIKSTDRILDVGTGTGEHVLELRDAGFLKATGIDPYIQSDIFESGDIIVKKGALSESLGQFDLITMHHSLEHMNDQTEVLMQATLCLRPGGKLLIRIPTVTSTAFREYKENWFQLDAPRHLYLHSHKSIKLMADQACLKLLDLWCDSNEMQFIVSEQYASNIDAGMRNSYLSNKKFTNLSRHYIRAMKKKSHQENLNLTGDQICLIFSMA